MPISLRPYQQGAVAEIREQFRQKNFPVVFVLPTGGGKTYTFCYIAENAAYRGRQVVILVHRKELLLQASKSFNSLGIKHGLISPDFTPALDRMVQVASVDTLIQRLKKPEFAARLKPGLLIIDEGHHVVESNKWGRVYDMLGRPPMLGVTATPVRTDGKGLGDHAGGLYKSMVLGPTVSELVQLGFLIEPTIYCSLEIPDLSGLKVNSTGDYNLADLAQRVDRPKITGDAVEHYRKICPGARAIVFCASIAHAKHVVHEFNAAGFKFKLLVGAPEMSDAERTEVNRALAAGEIDGACTVDLVSEGYDLPDLECCIMLRPTQSESLFLQQVGRIMRPADGKASCWLLDHVGNVGRTDKGSFVRKHGLPTEDREWTLDGRKKKGRRKKDQSEPTIAMKQCPNCWMVHLPASSCPSCGHVYPAGGREVEKVEGELRQITPEMAAALKAQRKKQISRARTIDELKEVAKQYGYSEQWAEVMFKQRKAAAEKYRRPEPPIEMYFNDR